MSMDYNWKEAKGDLPRIKELVDAGMTIMLRRTGRASYPIHSNVFKNGGKYHRGPNACSTIEEIIWEGWEYIDPNPIPSPISLEYRNEWEKGMLLLKSAYHVAPYDIGKNILAAMGMIQENPPPAGERPSNDLLRKAWINGEHYAEFGKTAPEHAFTFDDFIATLPPDSTAGKPTIDPLEADRWLVRNALNAGKITLKNEGYDTLIVAIKRLCGLENQK
jgi:hypothetical protein